VFRDEFTADIHLQLSPLPKPPVALEERVLWVIHGRLKIDTRRLIHLLNLVEILPKTPVSREKLGQVKVYVFGLPATQTGYFRDEASGSLTCGLSSLYALA
jgi:hypothetical protein